MSIEDEGLWFQELMQMCQCQRVNTNFYWEVLEKLCKRVMLVRPGINNNWVLYHEKAPCNIAISVNCFLASKNTTKAPQPMYEHDLSPCDFLLFPSLKTHLKEHCFGAQDNSQMDVTEQMKVSSFRVPELCRVEELSPAVCGF